MPNIRVEFEFPVPDEWGSDTFTQGKTDRDFYEGPEYLTFEVDNDPSSEDYGKETGWCLFEPEELLCVKASLINDSSLNLYLKIGSTLTMQILLFKNY